MNKTTDPQGRESFSGMYGAVIAIVGSAVGLGNIWRFPYIAGVYGGGAIILLYIIFVLVLGRPMMLTELTLGRLGQGNAFNAFRGHGVSPAWRIIGLMGILCAFVIMSYYTAIGGWTISYFIKSVSGQFVGRSASEVQEVFSSFVAEPLQPIVWQTLFMALTAVFIARGVSKGIEHTSRRLMPVLFLLLLLLDIRSVTLPGGMDGIRFLFKPDLSRLNSESVLAALGQVFFSLSLGMGAILTYGSYLPREENISKSAKMVTMADTVVSIMAAVAIFPAVFAFGIDPTSGPGLIFVTLPNVFGQMPGGQLCGTLFFFLVLIAAVTSAMSLLEVVTAFMMDCFRIGRALCTVLISVLIMILGVFCSLSLGIMADFTVFGKSVFDLMDFIASNLLLPGGGLLMALFLAYVLPRQTVYDEISSYGRWHPRLRVFFFLMRWIVPIGISLIFLNGLGIWN